MYGVDSKPYVLAGDAYLGQNRLSEAKKSYEKGLDICPKDAELKGKITALEEKIKI
jgi:predicted negative regulator of RcsB-dependent stress response